MRIYEIYYFDQDNPKFEYISEITTDMGNIKKRGYNALGEHYDYFYLDIDRDKYKTGDNNMDKALLRWKNRIIEGGVTC